MIPLHKLKISELKMVHGRDDKGNPICLSYAELKAWSKEKAKFWLNEAKENHLNGDFTMEDRCLVLAREYQLSYEITKEELK